MTPLDAYISRSISSAEDMFVFFPSSDCVMCIFRPSIVVTAIRVSLPPKIFAKRKEKAYDQHPLRKIQHRQRACLLRHEG